MLNSLPHFFWISMWSFSLLLYDLWLLSMWIAVKLHGVNSKKNISDFSLEPVKNLKWIKQLCHYPMNILLIWSLLWFLQHLFEVKSVHEVPSNYVCFTQVEFIGKLHHMIDVSPLFGITSVCHIFAGSI